jgi:SAM-dependent methyltransferase
MDSCLCTQAQLESAPFVSWAQRMRPAWKPDGSGRPVNLHRKLWEWVFIARALEERGMLQPGSRGLGFGVGHEPQAALFASLGCDVLATDLDPRAAGAAGWVGSGQNAAELAALNRDGLCPPEAFAQHVRFRHVDMNRVPPDLRGFDFTWSSCAFEHLGSIVRGQDFVLRQMQCLRPGGVAVHTTELNVSSDRRTLDWRGTVLFRRRDLEELAGRLRGDGHSVVLDFAPGTGPADVHVDRAPYSSQHLKVDIKGFVATSFGLIVTHGADGPRPRTSAAAALARRVRSAARLADSAALALRGPRSAE